MLNNQRYHPVLVFMAVRRRCTLRCHGPYAVANGSAEGGYLADVQECGQVCDTQMDDIYILPDGC